MAGHMAHMSSTRQVQSKARSPRMACRELLTIDVSRPVTEIADTLLAACQDVGFFYVSGEAAGA